MFLVGCNNARHPTRHNHYSHCKFHFKMTKLISYLYRNLFLTMCMCMVPREVFFSFLPDIANPLKPTARTKKEIAIPFEWEYPTTSRRVASIPKPEKFQCKHFSLNNHVFCIIIFYFRNGACVSAYAAEPWVGCLKEVLKYSWFQNCQLLFLMKAG